MVSYSFSTILGFSIIRRKSTLHTQLFPRQGWVNHDICYVEIDNYISELDIDRFVDMCDNLWMMILVLSR